MLNEQVGRLLTSAGVVDESNMTPEEFLNAVQRHLLLNLSEREEAFQEESLALDALLTRIMQEFSSISTEEPREEESKARFYKEQQRRDFYQAVIPNLMALGANPIHWMHQERQGTKTARVEATSSRGYLLAAQQVELILSNMEHRASFLGGTVLVLGEKFKRLMLATEEFAKHLYACAGDEHEWLWNKLGRFFDITDGARLERATVFWSVLELLYTMLDNGFSVEEAYMVRETSESTTIQLKTQTFQERQKLFRDAATAYVRRMQSNASDEPCELSEISEKELKLGKLAYRNYGRKTFLELLNAYLSIEGEFERLAEIRQCSENILNAAGAVAASKRQVEEANRRTEEERRQKEEANKRTEDGERSGAIFALLKSHLPVSYFHGILPKEKEARYRNGYQAVLQILREINPKEPEEKLKALILSQIKTYDAHAHLREFIVPVLTVPQATSSAQNRFTMYSSVPTVKALSQDVGVGLQS